MCRHACDLSRDGLALLLQSLRKALVIHQVCKPVPALRQEPLSQHDVKPAFGSEQVERFLPRLRMLREILDPRFEAVRHAHGRPVAPESGIAALRQVIVQDDEVANVLKLAVGQIVPPIA